MSRRGGQLSGAPAGLDDAVPAGYGLDESDRRALAALEAELAQLRSACVAFSGGVDSSLLLAASARALGAGHVVAFTAASATYLPEELAAARGLASSLGVTHEVVATDECDDPAFAANPRERCYLCKGHMLTQMARVAERHGCAALLDGANLDDLSDVRPGLRAAAERGVLHPLVAAGIGKAQVRRLARGLDLAVWNAPQQACLASRIPYGEAITADKLQAIAAGEAVLHELAFRQCRLRHHGAIARVEVPADEIARAAGPVREELSRRLGALGFTYVCLDLRGYRSGSMNEA